MTDLIYSIVIFFQESNSLLWRLITTELIMHLLNCLNMKTFDESINVKDAYTTQLVVLEILVVIRNITSFVPSVPKWGTVAIEMSSVFSTVNLVSIIIICHSVVLTLYYDIYVTFQYLFIFILKLYYSEPNMQDT